VERGHKYLFVLFACVFSKEILNFVLQSRRYSFVIFVLLLHCQVCCCGKMLGAATFVEMNAHINYFAGAYFI
jgi:hypothetical protein